MLGRLIAMSNIYHNFCQVIFRFALPNLFIVDFVCYIDDIYSVKIYLKITRKMMKHIASDIQ
jgi:hypothetical protein